MARRLVKRMPRFARPARREKYSTTEGSPSSLFAHLLATRPGLGGIAVDPFSALSCTPFFACVHVISEDIASLPVSVFKSKKSGGATRVDDHPVSVLFSRSPSGPANEMTSMQWRESWISHALTWGGGFSEIERAEDGDPLALHLMHPDRVRLVRDAQKRLFYEDTSLVTANGTPKLPAANVLHLAGLGFNGVQGYNITSLIRDAIGISRAAEVYGVNFFTNGAEPRGFIKHPGRLSPVAAGNLRESWNAVHQGVQNASKVGILEEGMEFQQTSTDPERSQLLATRQFQAVEMARVFRVPPHKIGDYTQAHLANIEASNLDYLMTVLRPWCVRVEQCLGLKLLTDKEHRLGYYVRHDIRALLRASIKDRALYYQAMFQFGMSPDEIRELEDLNPIGSADGGTLRFRSVNAQPLDIDTSRADPGAPAPPAPLPTTAGGDSGDGTAGEADTGASTYSHRLNGHFPHENGVNR